MNVETQLKALETYFELMSMNGGARVYRIARQCGVFEAVASGASSARAVADQCGLKEAPVRLLLDTLSSFRILRCHEGTYSLTPVMEFLTGSYRNLSDEYWDHLPELLRSGVPLARMDDAEQSEEQYKKQVGALAWMMRPAAEAVSMILGIGDSRKDLEILDVGAGSAVWSLACAQKDAGTRVTAVDWPAVLKIAESNAERLGLRDRFEGRPGNYHELDLPSDTYDLALVGNVTHIETPEGNEALFRKLCGALKAGGEVAIIDVMPGQERGDSARALYALGLALRTERGRVYSCRELQGFLREAGFPDSRFTPIPVCPYSMGVILARKGEVSC